MRIIAKISKKDKIEELIVHISSKFISLMEDRELTKAIQCVFIMDIKSITQTHITLIEVSKRFVVWILISIVLKERHIKDFNWDLLCEIYNEDFYKLLDDNIELFYGSELENIANDMLKNYRERRSTTGWVMYYKIIIDLYLYLSHSEYVNCFENIEEINLYKKYLGNPNTISIYEIESLGEYDFVRTYITNNYPLNSNYKDLTLIQYYHGLYKDYRDVYFNLRTNSKIVKSLLLEFLKIFSSDYEISSKKFKIFIYYFDESIGEKKIRSYEDFSEETLYKQYKFYSDLDSQFFDKKIIRERRKNVTSVLVAFYRFLIEVQDKYSIKRIFNKAVEMFLSKRLYNKVLKEGFIPVLHNTNEQPPKFDKFCIIPGEHNRHNSHSRNNMNITIDLTQVSDKYRKDVKNFIWYGGGNTYQISKHYAYIRQFIEYKMCFDERMNNVVVLNRKNASEFTEEFLHEFMTFIENKYQNPGSIGNVLKSIRKYLRYYSKEYKISDNYLKILTFYGLSTYDGGKVITRKDLETIYNKFKDLEEINIDGRLYTIVFEIFIYSNIRIGEILNFKRDCLEGSILSYLSKTSNGEKVVQEVSERIKVLIIEAMEITDRYKDDTFESQYIFILPIKRKVLSTCGIIYFYSYFKNIINMCQERLEVKSYNPYNIRHTFIDNVYREGIDNGLTISEIALIANNKFKTAVKHYRQYDKIDNYIEAMAKVNITNVDINGKILLKENSDEYSKVRKDLGKCPEIECNFKIGECLRCTSFITFVNRIPKFEKEIKNLNEQLAQCENELQIEEINAEKQLLAKYLSEMYKIEDRKSR